MLTCLSTPAAVQSHDARVMAAWKAQQAVWAQQAAHLSAVAAKHPAQLALTSGERVRHTPARARACALRWIVHKRKGEMTQLM